jgi:hypothetical protein
MNLKLSKLTIDISVFLLPQLAVCDNKNTQISGQEQAWTSPIEYTF